MKLIKLKLVMLRTVVLAFALYLQMSEAQTIGCTANDFLLFVKKNDLTALKCSNLEQYINADFGYGRRAVHFAIINRKKDQGVFLQELLKIENLNLELSDNSGSSALGQLIKTYTAEDIQTLIYISKLIKSTHVLVGALDQLSQRKFSNNSEIDLIERKNIIEIFINRAKALYRYDEIEGDFVENIFQTYILAAYRFNFNLSGYVEFFLDNYFSLTIEKPKIVLKVFNKALRLQNEYVGTTQKVVKILLHNLMSDYFEVVAEVKSKIIATLLEDDFFNEIDSIVSKIKLNQSDIQDLILLSLSYNSKNSIKILVDQVNLSQLDRLCKNTKSFAVEAVYSHSYDTLKVLMDHFMSACQNYIYSAELKNTLDLLESEFQKNPASTHWLNLKEYINEIKYR